MCSLLCTYSLQDSFIWLYKYHLRLVVRHGYFFTVRSGTMISANEIAAHANLVATPWYCTREILVIISIRIQVTYVLYCMRLRTVHGLRLEFPSIPEALILSLINKTIRYIKWGRRFWLSRHQGSQPPTPFPHQIQLNRCLPCEFSRPVLQLEFSALQTRFPVALLASTAWTQCWQCRGLGERVWLGGSSRTDASAASRMYHK